MWEGNHARITLTSAKDEFNTSSSEGLIDVDRSERASSIQSWALFMVFVSFDFNLKISMFRLEKLNIYSKIHEVGNPSF